MQLAISIRQPYTELILLGTKRFEYRTYPTNVRGRVMLYATKKAADDEAAWDLLDAVSTVHEVPMGVIVGSVEIVDCVERKPGFFAYELANPIRLTVPLKPIGRPQPCFWRPLL